MSETEYLYDLTTQLIAADTVSHRASAPAMELLANHLQGFGFETRLQLWEDGAKANLIAVAGPAEEEGLVLSGHVDVVPFEGQPGWEREPLALGIEDQRLFGRGTTDMKGFLGQCLDAARQLDLSQLRRPLVFLLTSDEEVGCQGGRRLAEELPQLLGETPRPKLAWIGEPTSWQVFHAHKGIIGFEVSASGEGGHSSRPEEGVNAIAVAARALVLLGELQQELRSVPASTEMRELFPEAPYATLNFGTIEGGTASNMIAEACRFTVSYRPLPDQAPLEIYEEVQRRLDAMSRKDWGSEREATLTVSPPFVAPGALASRGTPLEKALFEVLGQEDSGGAPYCTDAGHFETAGIECLVCGPGDLDEAHQPNESMDRAAFEEGPARILRVVDRLLTP